MGFTELLGTIIFGGLVLAGFSGGFTWAMDWFSNFFKNHPVGGKTVPEHFQGLAQSVSGVIANIKARLKDNTPEAIQAELPDLERIQTSLNGLTGQAKDAAAGLLTEINGVITELRTPGGRSGTQMLQQWYTGTLAPFVKGEIDGAIGKLRAMAGDHNTAIQDLTSIRDELAGWGTSLNSINMSAKFSELKTRLEQFKADHPGVDLSRLMAGTEEQYGTITKKLSEYYATLQTNMGAMMGRVERFTQSLQGAH
jgi:hypothetical protein